MAAKSELEELLSRVKFQPAGNYLEGLDPVRALLDRDSDGTVAKSLRKAVQKMTGEPRGGVAFLLANRWLVQGDLKALQDLFAIDDPGVKASVLGGLWGDPRRHPNLGPGIVQLGLEGLKHPVPEVRTSACSMLQNQAAWRQDVSAAVAPLKTLLADGSPRTCQQAAYAVGNFAKSGYDLSSHVPQLRQNVQHADMYVREANAWALWQLSKSKHDIAAAVPELVTLLANREPYTEQRKRAAHALLHHAQKSTANAKLVKQAIRGAKLNKRQKEVQRFLEKLAALSSVRGVAGNRQASTKTAARKGAKRTVPVTSQKLQQLRTESFFKNWHDFVDEEYVEDSEASIRQLIDDLVALDRLTEAAARKLVKACVVRFNDLDEGWICTIEREDICERIGRVIDTCGFSYDEDWTSERDW